jgi:hypothetical protein
MDPTLDEIGIKYAYDFGKGKNYTGGDKTSLGKNFTKIYESLFLKMKNDPLNLLELGIFHGKSLAMWSDYFVNGTIHGIDINLKYYYENLSKLTNLGAFANNNIKVFKQDITSESFKELLANLPNFDIIIDDANHNPNVQFNNFNLLFDKLNKNGYYIIEDIVDPVKHMDFFKNLYMCVSNCDYINNKIKKDPFYNFSTKIDSIEIRQNLIIVKKK